MGDDFGKIIDTVGNKLIAVGTDKKGRRKAIKDLKKQDGRGRRSRKTVNRLANAIEAEMKLGKNKTEALKSIKSASTSLKKDDPGIFKTRRGLTVRALRDEQRAANKAAGGSKKLTQDQKDATRIAGRQAFKSFRANQMSKAY